MNEDERRDLIEGYLSRLARELDDIPPSARRELIEDVRNHIEEAWAASALELADLGCHRSAIRFSGRGLPRVWAVRASRGGDPWLGSDTCR